MKLVLDANIVIAALLGSRGKVTILTSHHYDFYAPQKIIDEIRKYKGEISQKMGWTAEEFDIYYNALLIFITVVKYEHYQQYINSAQKAIRRDTKDADYIACALHLHADYIWTDDKDFVEQDIIPVKNTNQVIQESKGT